MLPEESAWSRMGARGWASLLGLFGFFVSFAGLAVYAFSTMMAMSFASWSIPWMPFGYPSYSFGMIDWFINTAIKMFALFFGMIGFAQANSGRQKPGGAVMVIAGTLLVLPFIVGGFDVLEVLLQSFGVLPLVPLVIGGSLFILAGVLFFAGKPPERPSHTISATVDSKPYPEPTVCSNCRTPLIGDEKYCPGCGKAL